MANEKIINTRIQLKYDSFSNWTTNNPTLKTGELAIAYLGNSHTTTSPDNGTHPVLFKVGPGAFNSLPWASALAADVYEWAKKPEADFKAWVKNLVPVEVIDNGTGKFVTNVTATNDSNGHHITITRSDVAFDDISDKAKIALSADLGAVASLTTTAKTAVGAINEHDTEIGDLSKLNTTNKGNLVNAINEALQAVEVGGTGSLVTVVKENKDKYVVKQGGNQVGDAIEIADATFDVRVGGGLAGTDVQFSANATENKEITISHADTSSVANVVAADRTYVKSLTFDEYGHVTAVSTGAETVVDTNTAHTHSVGDGLKKTGDGGIDGDVKYELNVAMKLEDGDIVIYDKDNNNEVARLDAAELLEDSYLNDVEIVNNELQFTWKMDDGTTKTDSVDLEHLVDVYKGSATDYITISVSGYTVSATLNKVDTAIIEDNAITRDKLDENLQAATDMADTLGMAISVGIDPSTFGPFIEFNDSVTIISGPSVYVDEEDENNRLITKEELDGSIKDLGNLASKDTITNADVASNAAIAHTKISGLGSFATKNVAETADVQDGAITYAKLSENLQGSVDTADALGAFISVGTDPTSISGPYMTFYDNDVYIGEGTDDYNNVIATKGDVAGAIDDLHEVATSGSVYDLNEVNVVGEGESAIKYFVFNCGSASTLID